MRTTSLRLRDLATLIGLSINAIVCFIASNNALGNTLPPETIPLTRISEQVGDHFLREPIRAVIRSREEWWDFWAKRKKVESQPSHLVTLRLVPVLPEVDFEKEMLIIAGLGIQPSLGYKIIVQNAYIEGEELLVSVHSERPGPDCVIFPALTSPVDIVRAPLWKNRVRFKEISEVTKCNK